MRFRVFWDVAPCSHVEGQFQREYTAGATSQKTQNFILAAVKSEITQRKCEVSVTGAQCDNNNKLSEDQNMSKI
jgi:hypothetical protein